MLIFYVFRIIERTDEDMILYELLSSVSIVAREIQMNDRSFRFVSIEFVHISCQ